MQDYKNIGLLQKIFKGRLTALKNRFNPLYDLMLRYTGNEELNELLFPDSAPFYKVKIRVPRFFEKTLFRNAEKIGNARIRGLARRFDCDVVILEDEKINEENSLNLDFRPFRNYEVVAGFYCSRNYLNTHMLSSRQRLRQRKNSKREN